MCRKIKCTPPSLASLGWAGCIIIVTVVIVTAVIVSVVTVVIVTVVTVAIVKYF